MHPNRPYHPNYRPSLHAVLENGLIERQAQYPSIHAHLPASSGGVVSASGEFVLMSSFCRLSATHPLPSTSSRLSRGNILKGEEAANGDRAGVGNSVCDTDANMDVVVPRLRAELELA